MNKFIDFIGFINQQLHDRSIPRLETMLMSATFSLIVGEFMVFTETLGNPFLAQSWLLKSLAVREE